MPDGRCEVYTVVGEVSRLREAINTAKSESVATQRAVSWNGEKLDRVTQQLNSVEQLLFELYNKDKNDPPIDMLLWCPECNLEHVDAPESCSCGGAAAPIALCGLCKGTGVAWNNPPHRTHLCQGCGHTWRPAMVPTNGVRDLPTAKV